MTAQYWNIGTVGDWSQGADWASGLVPTSTDAAVINNSDAVTISGTAVANSLALNASTVTDSGSLTLGTSLTLDGNAELVLIGGTLAAQSIASDSGTVGELYGHGTVSGAVSGDVTIWANGGTLKVQGALAGYGGSFFIDSSATLELTNGTAAWVFFFSHPGTLKLDAPTAFTGSINWITLGDTIDLAGITASSATYSGSTLTINETNGQHLTYDVSGSIAGDILTVASDNKGGTLVYWGQPAAVASISAATDNHLMDVNAGHVVTISVTTSGPVTVTGTPTLQLNDNEVAGYTGGSGTNTLTFAYAVQPGAPGDNVADLHVTGLNLPTGSSMVDSTGHSPSGSVTADLGIKIDTVTVPATSVQQEILGLYAALYGRATDSGGVSYWTGIVSQQPDGSGVTTANAGTTVVTLNDAAVLGQAFVNTQSTYFNSIYGSLNDSAFINAMYVNIGGNAGDPGGIAYWANILSHSEAAGQSVQAARAGLVGQFVHDLVDYNLAAGAAGLTSAQLLAADQRQATVDNKIAVSLALSNASQQAGGSILVVHTVGDAAYEAATTLIQGVTYDPATVTAAILGINNAVAHQNLLFI